MNYLQSLGFNFNSDAAVTDQELEALAKARENVAQALLNWTPGDEVSFKAMVEAREWLDQINAFMAPRLARDLKSARASLDSEVRVFHSVMNAKQAVVRELEEVGRQRAICKDALVEIEQCWQDRGLSDTDVIETVMRIVKEAFARCKGDC